jgi:exosortase family protein XrtF
MDQMIIYRKWKQIPRAVYLFFIRVFVLFIAWKSIYLYFLLPKRVLDGPLTYTVGLGTTKTLNFLTHSKDFTTKSGISRFEGEGGVSYEEEMDIFYKRERVLEIADACNALELLALYTGFIVCFPSKISRKLAFIFSGIIMIYILNLFRCAFLTLIVLHYPRYLDFSHHFLFTFVVYGFIFLLWYIFAQKMIVHARPNQ